MAKSTELEPKIMRMGVAFKPEEYAAVERIQKKLEPTMGRVSVAAVIRMALMKMDREGL